MTGETDLIKKSVDKPMLFSNTHVMEGSAKFLVLSTSKLEFKQVPFAESQD